jgi:hypothetical protein
MQWKRNDQSDHIPFIIRNSQLLEKNNIHNHQGSIKDNPAKIPGIPQGYNYFSGTVDLLLAETESRSYGLYSMDNRSSYDSRATNNYTSKRSS